MTTDDIWWGSSVSPTPVTTPSAPRRGGRHEQISEPNFCWRDLSQNRNPGKNDVNARDRVPAESAEFDVWASPRLTCRLHHTNTNYLRFKLRIEAFIHRGIRERAVDKGLTVSLMRSLPIILLRDD